MVGDPVWAKLFSTVANVVTLDLVTWAARLWWVRPAFPGLALLPALLLAVNFGFVLWGVGGLETALYTTLVTAGLLRLVWEAGDLPTPAARFPIAALLFALATLARPDGTVLFAGGMLGWGLWALATRRVGWALVRRWEVETLSRDAKQYLGLEQCQCWVDQAPVRDVALVLLGFVVLQVLRQRPDEPLAAVKERW